MKPETLLIAEMRRRYQISDFPALYAQQQRWATSRPLDGCSVIDASPLFFNSFAKYAALLCAGAKLTVGVSEMLPHDAKAEAFLREIGIPVSTPSSGGDDTDIVLDCGAIFQSKNARYGYAELTRTGALRYQATSRPVFLADDGLIKMIETSLGTGDGFVRAMEQLGHHDFNGRSVLIFGCGKVGRGIALACIKRGAFVYVIDDGACVKPPEGVPLIDKTDIAVVTRAIGQAWAIVCATGRAGAAAPYADALIGSEALLANMGIEDEFGASVPEARVLFGKKALNFLLDEPTRLRYIDATLALHNVGACLLKSGAIPAGIHPPNAQTEADILADVRAHGDIAQEIDRLLPHAKR